MELCYTKTWLAEKVAFNSCHLHKNQWSGSQETLSNEHGPGKNLAALIRQPESSEDVRSTGSMIILNFGWTNVWQAIPAVLDVDFIFRLPMQTAGAVLSRHVLRYFDARAFSKATQFSISPGPDPRCSWQEIMTPRVSPNGWKDHGYSGMATPLQCIYKVLIALSR